MFADRGGAWALEQGLEAQLGVDVHMLYEWGTDSNTIHSGTAFMSWDTDGQQASLLNYVHELPADIKDNPTAVVWMHNEYDQNDAGLTMDSWLAEVQADAGMLRDALGQGADTTPYTFVPIRYPYGGNFAAIGDGMAALDADPEFNAEISWEAQSLAMDGGPEAGSNGSHMGDADAVNLGNGLVAGMAETLRALANGSEGTVMPPPPPPPLEFGEGSDALVLSVSQDAYDGSAQYMVSVDGQQMGGTLTASASRAAGQSDTLTLRGDWGPGEHRVEVAFLNDAWGGTADTDRNLHVDGATYNGLALDGAAATLWTEGAAAFSFAEAEGQEGEEEGGAGPEPQPQPVVRAGTDGADLFEADAAGGTFTGGGGRDLFLFEAGDGRVTVTDFAPRTDKLVFVDMDAADVAAAAATEGGVEGLLVTYGGEEGGGAVFLAGVDALGPRDLVFA